MSKVLTSAEIHYISALERQIGALEEIKIDIINVGGVLERVHGGPSNEMPALAQNELSKAAYAVGSAIAEIQKILQDR